jgi:hypothetical protein
MTVYNIHLQEGKQTFQPKRPSYEIAVLANMLRNNLPRLKVGRHQGDLSFQFLFVCFFGFGFRFWIWFRMGFLVLFSRLR